MPQPFSITCFLAVPFLIIAGLGLLWLGWDIGDSIHGAATFESMRLAIRALMAAVTGIGLLFISWALYVRGTREMGVAGYLFSGGASLILYGLIVTYMRYRLGIVPFESMVVPTPFLLWAALSFITVIWTSKEAT